MIFYNYIRDKAASYGHQCPQCGKNDGYFALNNKCNLCQAPMLRHGKLLDMLFSLEVFMEFIDRYVKNDSVFKEEEIKKLFDRTINGLRKEKPEIIIDEINLIQRLFRSGLKLESMNDEWSVVLNSNETEIINYKDPKMPIPTNDRDGFIGFIIAIQFITRVNFDSPFL